MVSRRPITNDKLVMVCPPYVCVPYEPRKQFVCAYCFKEFRKLEERHKAQQEAEAAAKQASNDGAEQQIVNAVEQIQIDAVVAEATQLSDTISGLDVQDDPHANSTAMNTEESTTNEAAAADEEPDIDALLQCQGCRNLWYCNEECRLADLPEHSRFECPALAKFDIPWAKEYYSYCDDLITDIRLLIRAMNKRYWQLENGINEYEEEYQLLISNMSCYKEDVLASLRTIVQYTNYLLPDPLNPTDDELLEIYCKHRVNMFGLWANGGECLGYGVYPRASYFNHSCWPNATFYKNPDLKVPHMNFLTVWPIEKEGEEVCISYIDISAGLRDRRDTLLDKYFFHCTCERCMLQELSPEGPDPYYIYWAPAPPPDGYAPGYEPTGEEGDVAAQMANVDLNEAEATLSTVPGQEPPPVPEIATLSL